MCPETTPETEAATSRPPPVYDPRIGLLFDPEQKDIAMNRWRLKDVLQTMKDEYDRPNREDFFRWLGTLLAFLLALIPNDFDSFLGVPQGVWSAIAIGGAAISAYQLVGVVVAIWDQRKQPRLTPMSIVQQFEDEMRLKQQPPQQDISLQDLQSQHQAATPLTPVPQSIPDTAGSPP